MKVKMDIVLKGILTDLLSIFVSNLFMLIETSMTRGFRAAGLMPGYCFMRAFIITVALFTSWIDKALAYNEYFNKAGGLVFMGFGINYILSRKRGDTVMQGKSRYARLFMNGFFINLLNPSVVIFWLGSMALVLSQFRLTGREILIYFGSALGVVALTDWIKAYFAYRLSRFLNSKVLRILYILSGILMIGLGIYIMLK
jgi:threonine/homoserine/homoserine lactone efflux protein